MNFNRYIDPQFVSALNELYRSDVGRWWKALLSDPDIFLAIRDNAIKAYYRGCTLATIRLDAGELRASSHYRYLVRPATRSPYVEFQFGRLESSWQYAGIVEELADTDKLKRAARPYSIADKNLAGRIARHNRDIFDMEIALTPKVERNDDRSSRRLDFAAVRDDGRACKMVFYRVRGLARVTLKWNEPPRRTVQYERFLYRVHRFSSLFEWFEIAADNNLVGAKALAERISGAPLLTLNVAGPRPRMLEAKRRVLKAEAMLEAALIESAAFKDRFGFEEVDHQLPVGLFAGAPKESSEIFPRRSSAIDLIATKKRRLWLFELKTSENKKVGILTEILFYASVIRDATLDGPFRFDPSGLERMKISRASIRECDNIRAVMLAEKHKGVTPNADDAWSWSMWQGYLKADDGRAVRQAFETGGARAAHIHTSGHASPADLRAFAAALSPTVLVPIHGVSWDAGHAGFPAIRRLADGEPMAL